MKRVSVIFAFAVIALFSISIVINLAYGLKDVDITGFVTATVDDVELPEFDGEICTDSDNGRKYVKGETAVYNSVAVDYCLDDTQLVEYSCSSLFRTSKIHVCPYGCRNGACV